MIVFEIAFCILCLLIVILLSIGCVYLGTKIVIGIIEMINEAKERHLESKVEELRCDYYALCNEKGELERKIVDMEMRLRHEMDVR